MTLYADADTIMNEARDDLVNKWKQFNEELRDISTEFNHLYWIQVLFFAAVNYLLHIARLVKLSSWLVSKRGHAIQFLPLFVICIVSLVLVAYCLILHQEVIAKRWCGVIRSNDESCHVGCRSSQFILCGVCYIGVMILYNFLRTTFTSPGIATLKCLQDSNTRLNDDINHGNGNAADKHSNATQWKSFDGQGGCCYLSLKPCIDEELYLQRKYTIQLDETQLSSLEQMQFTTIYIPNPFSSYCKKCSIVRPPRCHHCSKCNRCVLQMDHHCFWINNCIGYNNYRTFVLTLFYLVIGCWFGVSLLFPPFYATIQVQIQRDGFKFMYKHKSGFLDLPMPMDLLQEFQSTGRLNTDLVLKIVFVILLFAGLPLTLFLYSHICCMVQGLTTLEKLSKIEFQRFQLLRSRQSLVDRPIVVINPYQQERVWNNLLQVIGSNPWLCLLPIPVQPLAPTMSVSRWTTSSRDDENESYNYNNIEKFKEE